MEQEAKRKVRRMWENDGQGLLRTSSATPVQLGLPQFQAEASHLLPCGRSSKECERWTRPTRNPHALICYGDSEISPCNVSNQGHLNRDGHELCFVHEQRARERSHDRRSR